MENNRESQCARFVPTQPEDREGESGSNSDRTAHEEAQASNAPNATHVGTADTTGHGVMNAPLNTSNTGTPQAVSGIGGNTNQQTLLPDPLGAVPPETTASTTENRSEIEGMFAQMIQTLFGEDPFQINRSSPAIATLSQTTVPIFGQAMNAPVFQSSTMPIFQTTESAAISDPEVQTTPNIATGTEKVKIDSEEPSSSLEILLNSIASCIVCLDLPNGPVYQCRNGHVMCEACWSHIIVEGAFNQRAGKCPACRISLSKDTSSRNVVLEKMMSEMPVTCMYCDEKYESKVLQTHIDRECSFRPVKCKYSPLGCGWAGSYFKLQQHVAQCAFANMTGKDLLAERNKYREAASSKEFLELEKVLNSKSFLMLELELNFLFRQDSPCYQSVPFWAFGCRFTVRVIPNLNCQYPMWYQLIQISNGLPSVHIKYFIVPGPISGTNTIISVDEHTFCSASRVSPVHCIQTHYKHCLNLFDYGSSIQVRLFMASGDE